MNASFLLRKPSVKKNAGSFSQYLLYFFLIAAIIIFICITSIRSYMHKIVSEHLIEINNNVITQIKASHDILLDEINNSLTNIIFDKEFLDFEANASEHEEYNILKKLDTISFSNPAFSGITLYYPSLNKTISTSEGITDIKNSADKKFIESITSTPGQYRYSQFRVRSNRQQTKVISMLKSIPINSNNPTAYVIFDIDATYISKLLSSLNISNSMFLIMDRYGNYISKENIPTEISKEIFKEFENIEYSELPTVYEKKFQRNKMYVSASFSPKHQWTYFSLIPFSAIQKELGTVNNFIILLSVFMFLAAVAASYVLSTKAHAPIAQIAQKLKVNNSKAPLAAIEKNIDNIIDENKNLTHLLSDYTLHLKQNFLQDLLLGRIGDIDIIKSKLSYYNMTFLPDDYFMSYSIKINIDRENIEYEQQNNMLTVYISELIQDKLLHIYPGFILQTGDYEYALIISFKKDKTESSTTAFAHSLSSRIHKTIAQTSAYSFDIGVSNLHAGILNIPAAYKESKFALYSNRIVSHNNITLYCNVSSESSSIEYPYLIEQKLTTAIISGNQHETQEAFKQLKQYIIKNSTARTNNTRILYIQLLTALSKCVSEMSLTSESLSAKEAKLYSTALYEDISEDMFISMLKEFLDEILPLENNIKNNRNQPILETIKNYIRENLHEDLSIDTLSEKFYVSSSYLRKLFKDVYSITLKTYIDNERIRRAKELLCDPNVKISDIPQRIGYLSSQSFTRAFKQHTGKTPGGYRNENLKK